MFGSLVLVLLAWLFGTGGDKRPEPGDAFVSVILRDTEDVWESLFKGMGRKYSKPSLVLYTGSIDSACGREDSSFGPFYCSGDSRLYLDLDFFRELSEEYQAGGDFAQAYVIAHEVGHHVQNLLGENKKPASSVQLELQADFFAGVWAHHAQKRWNFLQAGDVEEALNAAAAIGDDRIQMKNTGVVFPDQFTHGSAEQRVRCFLMGFKSGAISDGVLSRMK